MNLYFLVEGKETEPQVYHAWLKYLLPEYKKVDGFDEVSQKSYFLRKARKKTPSLTERIANSIREINAHGGYDYFVICLDAEDKSMVDVTEGIYEILAEFAQKNLTLPKTVNFELIIQNRCIETWFLGNRKIFSRQPQNPELMNYINHFNVYTNDPELMERPQKDRRFGSHAQFHVHYLKALLEEKNLAYDKDKTNAVTEKHYLEQLQARIQQTNHLNSFRHFSHFCNKIRQQLPPF